MKLLLLAHGLFPLLALAGDPVAQLTFHVVTDDGRAVTGAPVVMATAEGWRPGKTDYGYTQMREVRGVTDAGGFVTLKLPCKTGNIRRYAVEGVYDRATKMEFGGAVCYVDRGRSFSFTNQVGNKWQPWNPTVELQIMRVENPIPMYARSYVNSIPGLYMPDVGKPVGFDLMKGDWIAPHGSGETCDVIFKLDVTSLGQRKTDRGPMFDAVFSVAFTNEGDGLQAFYAHPREGNALRSPRFAPVAGYTNQRVATAYEHETDSYREEREDQNYFFRVRTRRDESGRIVSALYGKIYGEIDFGSKGDLRFRYYLNPTPNDRNLEFDPALNLFTNLPSLEQVRDP